MKKLRYISLVAVFLLIIGAFSLGFFIEKDNDISLWERRKLQQLPSLSFSSLMSGDFMKSFETYLTDQFPLRDKFRSLKAQIHFNLLRQKDNGGIYIHEGSASKLDVSINESSVDYFAKRINRLYETYIKDTDCKAYYSVIPDKNALLAPLGGYPHLDYEKLYSMVDERLEGMKKIDITKLLSAEDFYSTDSHWRQERIVALANTVREAMGMKSVTDYEEKTAGDFYGVYYGQSALPLEKEPLIYLTNDEIENSSVYNMEKGTTSAVYNLSDFENMDPYDVFLAGATPLLEITNPDGEKGRELIVFRDSFGSSLAPLLLGGYEKVTLVDIRYIASDMVGQFVDFDSQDVLFVYSTLLINSSSTLK